PLWWAREVPGWDRSLGPHDPPEWMPTRTDGAFADGDGSPYWLLATALPGFRQFRYPSKLLTLTTLALTALAGVGWDRITSGRGRRAAAFAGLLLALSVAALAATEAYHGPILEAFTTGAPKAASPFGPLNPRGALHDLRHGLVHGSIVVALALALAIAAPRRPRTSGALALVALAIDLATANAGLVMTVPQAALDAKPRALELIEEAERDDPAPGPFRIHRMPQWDPIVWLSEGSPD